MFSPQLTPAVQSSRRPRASAPPGAQSFEASRRSSQRAQSMASLQQSRPQSRGGDGQRSPNPLAVSAATQQSDKINYFTKNSKYGVAKLPGVPNALRSTDGEITGLVDASHRNHALLLSHKYAYIWKYTDQHTLPHTFSFTLPKDESRTNPDAPLPVGSLVTPTANSDEPGLVVVLPISGDISYWDSVGAAVAEGLLGKKRGVEGKVTLMSGEFVTAITSVEPAGFLLSLSSGRVARLTLTTSSGAPDVQVVFMNKHSGLLGGLFGALKPGSFRREIVAIRAGAIMAGSEREAIVATARGNFFRWKIYRNGGEKLLADVDLRDQIMFGIRRNADGASQRNSDQFVILDVAVGKYADSESGSADDSTLDCLVLAAFLPAPNHEEEDAIYALVDVQFVAGGRAVVNRTIPITCYSTPVESSRTSRPRIFLPKPRNTAFVVLNRAVLIISLLRPPPAIHDGIDDMMVDEDEVAQSTVFEDVIDFRGDLNVDIVGCGMEDAYQADEKRLRTNVSLGSSMTQMESSHTRLPGVVVMARGAAAVIRVEAYPAISEAKAVKRIPISEKIKTKLEQAVFYGDKDQNPLSFEGRKEIQYPIQEVERAALTISSEILSSNSTFVPSQLPSVENHLIFRAKRLRALAEHLHSNYPPLSAATRWALCADAEKLEAARTLWKSFEIRKKEDRSHGMLERMLQIVLQAVKTRSKEILPDFFVYDLANLDSVVSTWKKAVISRNLKDDESRLRAIEEASQITLDILQKSFEFRITNAALYGFKDNLDRNGIMDEMKGLKEPATSKTDLLENLSTLYDTMINVAKMRVQAGGNIDEDTASVVSMMPDIAELLCRTYVERYRWSAAQSSDPVARKDKYGQEAASVKERYEASRGEWIKPLSNFGQSENAYEIGERFHDYATLVEICCDELIRLNATPEESLDAEDREALQQAIVGEEKRLERYFEDFGEPFAQKFYEYQVQNGTLRELLSRFQNYKEYLDKFLHSDPKFQRISWIHDVGKGDFTGAGHTLLSLATQTETLNQNKRIELSIAKLSLLASQSNGEKFSEQQQNSIDSELDITVLQDEIRAILVRPVANAVDHAAALDLLLPHERQSKRLKNRPQTINYLRNCLGKVLKGQVLSTREFIEVLTLAVPDSVPGYFYAIKVLSPQKMKDSEKSALKALIWRRCFMADEWDKLSTEMKKLDDASRQERVTMTALYKTMVLCEKEGFFAANSPMQPVKPSEALAKEADESRKEVDGEGVDVKGYAQEEIDENKILTKYIKADLEGWWEGSKEWAKSEAREVNEEDGEGGDVEMEG